MVSATLHRTRAVLVLALAAALSMVLVAPASAHTELESSTPAEGSTVDTLTEVALTFSSPLLDIGNELSIVDSEGTTHALEPELPTPDTISAPVTSDLAPGATQLVWRVVAEDGHPIEGVIDFTYAPEGADSSATASAAPTLAPTDAPTPTADPSAAASATASATPSPSASPIVDDLDEGGIDAWVWWVIAGVVVVVAAVAVAVSRRK